jgi:anti-anti-sigma factor
MVVIVPHHGPGLDVRVGETPQTLVVAGELDIAGARTLVDAVRAAAGAAVSGATIVLDLSALTFMDLMGLRALREAGEGVVRDGRRLVARGLGGAPARLLDLLGERLL